MTTGDVSGWGDGVLDATSCASVSFLLSRCVISLSHCGASDFCPLAGASFRASPLAAEVRGVKDLALVSELKGLYSV